MAAKYEEFGGIVVRHAVVEHELGSAFRSFCGAATARLSYRFGSISELEKLLLLVTCHCEIGKW